MCLYCDHPTSQARRIDLADLFSDKDIHSLALGKVPDTVKWEATKIIKDLNDTGFAYPIPYKILRYVC